MGMESAANLCDRAKPFLGVICLQFGYAGLSIIFKHALNQGISQHVLVVYRHAIATLVIAPFAFVFDRKQRPRMTTSVLLKIILMGVLEPTIDQNLYYTGMKYTTATFASAMSNVLPAFAFLMAWVLRLEKVKIREVHSQAKIIGTIVTVGGAMVMTLYKGNMLALPWTFKGYDIDQQAAAASTRTAALITKQDPIKGALMMTLGCICWASFINLQAITQKEYPAELSLTVWICFMGTIQSTILALVMERGNPSVWSIGLDYKLLAAAYSGIICSGLAYYIQGLIMKRRGPVFVTAFNPLNMILVAIMGSFVLKEILYLGRVIGAIVIVSGLYLVLWGKSKDQATPTSSNIIVVDKVAPSTTQMASTTTATLQERTMEASTKEFVVINVAVIRPTEESD